MRGLTRAVLGAAALVMLAASVSACAQISSTALRQANEALQAGEADRALSLLAPLPNQGPGAAEAQNLLCRVRFTLQQWDAAVAACEQAVRLEPNRSGYHLWLGRALGQKAGHASFLTAYSLGKRTRQEFEQAVRLDPRNADALADLGEFDTDAPGIVGGGLDKAEAIAAQLDKVNPAKAWELRGNIALVRKDFGAAERSYKQAIAASPHPAEQWSILANFYRQRQRWSEMESSVKQCAAAAAHDCRPGVALYDGAGVLIAAHRNPALAAKMLTGYLAGSSKSDEAPAFLARIRLARLEQQLGDAAGARQEFAAAAAMAREFNPAQDANR